MGWQSSSESRALPPPSHTAVGEPHRVTSKQCTIFGYRYIGIWTTVPAHGMALGRGGLCMEVCAQCPLLKPHLGPLCDGPLPVMALLKQERVSTKWGACSTRFIVRNCACGSLNRAGSMHVTCPPTVSNDCASLVLASSRGEAEARRRRWSGRCC